MSGAVCKDNDDLQRVLADLEKASEDVRVAAGALQLAEKNLKRAEAELEEAREHPRAFKVTILYNGLQREIEAKLDELVKVLLAHSIAAFGSPPNPHTLSLFTTDGRELKDDQTVREAGVKPCETLLLRPGAIKGGR
jgi:hypothetical protein